jgi:hypothetical protein
MEEQDEKSLEPSPKAHLISLKQAGHPWQKAAAMAGLHISRSTAYRLLQAIPTRETPRSSMEDTGIQPSYEKPCFNGWLQPAAPIHRRQVGRCK